VVVHIGGDGVDVDDGAIRVDVPQHGVVLDGVVADGDHYVSGRDDDVAGLVAEQSHPAQVVIFQRR
jgi:hypothetical protein